MQFNIAARLCFFIARVAELVDAADSKSAVRKDVLVRFQSRAQNLLNKEVFLYLKSNTCKNMMIYATSTT